MQRLRTDNSASLALSSEKNGKNLVQGLRTINGVSSSVRIGGTRLAVRVPNVLNVIEIRRILIVRDG